MIPHQIYCDYLEDKGVDTRLLRTQEGEGIIVSNSKQCSNCFIGYGNGFGNGYGYGDGYGLSHGDGYGNTYGNTSGCGYLYGLSNGNGRGGRNDAPSNSL